VGHVQSAGPACQVVAPWGAVPVVPQGAVVQRSNPSEAEATSDVDTAAGTDGGVAFDRAISQGERPFGQVQPAAAPRRLVARPSGVLDHEGVNVVEERAAAGTLAPAVHERPVAGNGTVPNGQRAGVLGPDPSPGVVGPVVRDPTAFDYNHGRSVAQAQPTA